MTTLQAQVKAAGLDSAAAVERLLGDREDGRPVVDRRNLANWRVAKPKLLEAVLLGCAQMKERAKR